MVERVVHPILKRQWVLVAFLMGTVFFPYDSVLVEIEKAEIPMHTATGTEAV